MNINKANLNWNSLGFNVVETRSMFIAKCQKGSEWTDGSLFPYGTIELSPAAVVLNYGQGVFEGTKAYQTSLNNMVLFRIDRNAKRMAWSTKRLCIPEINPEFFINSIISTVKDNSDFIPPYGKGSLYVRPIIWGTSPALGVQAASEYTFIIFVSPVGPYFKNSKKTLTLKVETNYHRAALKGIGNAKAIGNYSASLYPASRAQSEGFDEVIYLDSVKENCIEEIGSANLFVYHNGILKTPRLSGSILDGVTRNSVCRIASDILGLKVEETDIFLQDLFEADEVFCTGTAVEVTSVGKISYNDVVYEFPKTDVARKCKDTLLSIQREEIIDPFGWLLNIND